MGSVVNSIARSDIGRAFNTVSRSDPGRMFMDTVGSVGGPGALEGIFGGEEAPESPGIDPNLNTIKQQQLKQAKDFRRNLSGMERSMGESLKSQANRGMQQSIDQARQNQSSRGMLYSGQAAGQESGIRAKAQAGLGQGLADLHSGLLTQANNLDAQAIETGLGIQRSQQQLQDMIYANALTKMNADNAMTGNMIGSGINAGLLLAMA
jgi:hypothetical protein